VKNYVESHAHYLDWLAPIVGALFVVIAGKLLARRKAEPAVEESPVHSGGHEHLTPEATR
jgi:hypothetical protein